MRKYIIGAIIGATLATSVSASAEEIQKVVQSFVGEQVEANVKVTVLGRELTVPGIIINGTSFAPVRAVGEAIGLAVQYDETRGVLLQDPSVVEATYKPKTKAEIEKEITQAQHLIQAKKDRIVIIEETVKRIRGDELTEERLKYLQFAEVEKKKENDEIAKIELQIVELQKQLAQ